MNIKNIREDMIEDILENIPEWELLDYLTDMRKIVMDEARENLELMNCDDLIDQFEDTMNVSVEENIRGEINGYRKY